MTRTLMLVVAAAALCAAGLGRAADARAAELLYGVDTENRLVALTSQAPTAIKRIGLTACPTGSRSSASTSGPRTSSSSGSGARAGCT